MLRIFYNFLSSQLSYYIKIDNTSQQVYQYNIKINANIQINNINLYKHLMMIQNQRPDEQKYHHLKINNQEVQVTFRYFSPKKQVQDKDSQNNSNSKIKQSDFGKGSASSSSIANQITVIKQLFPQKVVYNPQIQSDRFYQSKIQQIKYPLLEYYEKFHKRLYQKILPQQKTNRPIKLQLTSKSKQKVLQKHQNSSSIRKTYVKRVQISLQSQQKILNKKKDFECQDNQRNSHRKPIFFDTTCNSKNSLSNQPKITQVKNSQKQNISKPNIVIRLYEKNNKLLSDLYNISNEVSYITPRRKQISNRKGIKVYSSQGKRKQSIATQGNQKINNSYITSTHNNSINIGEKTDRIQQNQLKSNKKKSPQKQQRQTLKQRYGQQFVQDLKRKKQETKRRVLSKSKLNRKDNPISQSIGIKSTKNK